MAKTVELLLAKPNMERMRSRSIFICEGMINHWTAPLQGILAPLLQGYQIGLQSGDLESAAINRKSNFQTLHACDTHLLYIFFIQVRFRVLALYYSGRQLDSLLVETKTSINAMEHMNQNTSMLFPWLILFKKLAGTFKENEMDFDGTMKIALESDNHLLRAYTIMCLMELNVSFQQWQDAAKLLEDNNVHEVLLGFFASARFTFFEGLISIQITRRCDATKWLKKSAWKRRAYKSRKMISNWVKKGNVNLVHYLHLLDAELAALNGKYKKAQVSFTAAITVARRNDFVQDRALAHELASAFFERRGDAYWKDYHMERCLECYNEWGAVAKVHQLREKNER